MACRCIRGDSIRRLENWLVLFDFRNVPLIEQGAGHKNVKTLAHEGTHQLTFNTGLLNRQGDAPRAVVEGIALYGETRSLHGHGAPGQINGTRLDDLAHIQRREKWISATDLLTDDAAAFGTTLDQHAARLCRGMAPGLLPDEDSRPAAAVSGVLEDDLDTHRQESSVRRRGEAFRRSRSTGSRPAARGDPAPAREAAVTDLASDTHAERPCPPPRRRSSRLFSDAEREELGHLGYLVARLDELRAARADRAGRLCDGRRREPGPPPGDRTERTLSGTRSPRRRSSPRKTRAMLWSGPSVRGSWILRATKPGD